MEVSELEKAVEATLVLEGELRERELLEAGEQLFRLMHRGCRWVVLDFFDVSHVDYRGVRTLITRGELFRKAGGGLVLTGLTPYIARILQVGGVHPEHFDCYPRIEDAWEAISRERSWLRPAAPALRAG
jgi:anti-anti-sigma factor